MPGSAEALDVGALDQGEGESRPSPHHRCQCRCPVRINTPANERFLDQRIAHAPKVNRPAATRHRGRKILLGFRNEDEDRRRSRFLQCLQQRVRCLLRRVARLLEQEDLPNRLHRRQNRLSDRRSSLVDPEALPAFGKDSNEVGMVPARNSTTAPAIAIVRGSFGTQQLFRERSSHGGLPEPRHPGEEVGVGR